MMFVCFSEFYFQTDYWASIPKLVGSNFAVVGHISQLAQRGYKLRVTPQISF